MFQIEEEKQTQRAKITVVGVGGGGGNALKTMYQSGFSGVDFLVANTDMQAFRGVFNRGVNHSAGSTAYQRVRGGI